MEEINLTRRNEETFDDFFVRLFQNKESYGITCQDIADILNRDQDTDFGESKWRKEYAAFQRGMRYAEQKTMRSIANRILCLSDLHIPFNLPIDTFAQYADGAVDTLVLNGDITDCQAISKFPKSYRLSPMEEIKKTREYLIELVNYINPSKVVVNYGNHDIRFQSYLSKNLDSDLLELMPKTALDLIILDGFHHYDKRLGTKTNYAPIVDVIPSHIEIEYTGSWFCQIGKTIFCHPITYSSGILKTAERALQFFRNEGYLFDALVMGHTHRIGDYKMGNTTMFEQGCCCDVKKQHYSDGMLTGTQKEGFIYLCQDKDGNIVKEHTKLIDLN